MKELQGMTSFSLAMAEAEVWRLFANESDITAAMQKLERLSPEKADKARAEIKEILYAD